jgi:hypothetical protein
VSKQGQWRCECDALAIAREYFPGWSDDELGFLVWNETAYPFNVAHDGREDALRRQFVELVQTLERNPAYVLGSWEGRVSEDGAIERPLL